MIKFALLDEMAFDVARNSIWLIGYTAYSHRLPKTHLNHHNGAEERKIRST